MELKGMEVIKARILASYITLTNFAERVGWTRQKTSMIVSGKQMPSLEETYTMAVALKMPLEELADFFLTNESEKHDSGV